MKKTVCIAIDEDVYEQLVKASECIGYPGVNPEEGATIKRTAEELIRFALSKLPDEVATNMHGPNYSKVIK